MENLNTVRLGVGMAVSHRTSVDIIFMKIIL